jgi:hypothetical protein
MRTSSAIADSLSSGSDNQAYPQACLDAANDYPTFMGFRRNPVYGTILENVDPPTGAAYLAEIVKDPEILGAIELFKANDAWGGPVLHAYPGIGEISPNTLRYVRVLAELKALFGDLGGMDICEIGVGYGGQCRIINALYEPATYWLVDVQPALALTQRYLGHYITPAVLSFLTMNELHAADHDLAISNYAFTELPREVQDTYLRKVILRSRRGYMIYNQLTPPEYRSYRAAELVEMIPGARIIPETPLTFVNNCIIVWGA